MANWTNLKAAIAETVTTNGNQEITGAVLRSTLNAIINAVGANATFAGVATPTTNPGVHDGPVFYLAGESGSYPNFSHVLFPGEIAVFTSTETGWDKKILATLDIYNADEFHSVVYATSISEVNTWLADDEKIGRYRLVVEEDNNDSRYTLDVNTISREPGEVYQAITGYVAPSTNANTIARSAQINTCMRVKDNGVWKPWLISGGTSSPDSALTNAVAANTAAISRVEAVSYNISIAGEGNTYVEREIFLLPGHAYRFYVADPQWKRDELEIASDQTIFKISQTLDGKKTDLAVVWKHNDDGTKIKSYYGITAVEGATYTIGLRANEGENVKFVLRDMSTLNSLNAQLLYNRDAAYSNVFIDGANLCIKPDGFGVVLNGKTYYVATTTSQTTNYTFAGSSPYLVVDVSQLTIVNDRNEVATVVKSRTQAQLKDTDIVIAYYYAASKKWILTNLFADLYDAPAKAKAIETNTSNIAKNTSNITTNADAIARVEDVSYNLSVLGAGTTFLKREIFTLPSHNYRLYISSRWSTDEVTVGSLTIFQIKQIIPGEEKVLHIVYKENVGGSRDVKSYYDFTALEGATYEIGIRADVGENVKFVLHDMTDTLDHGSILYLNDERDIVPKFLASTRAAKRTGSTESLTPQLVLAHFSDIHASKTNYNRVMEFCDKYSEYINDILHTGDTVNDTFGSISALWSNNKVLNCIGNHDTAKWENGKYNWTGATPQETYDNYFAPYIASWGVVQPENAAEQGKCYYYKDYTEQGVRLITLDCMRYDDAQHAWLSSVLDSAKTAGLHVIVAVHYPLDRGTAVDTPFHSLQATYTSEADSRIADVVASSGVQFIAYLCGHTHWDEFFKVKGYDGQICICVDSATLGDAYNDAARTAGTKNQDSFNIFSVDTYGKMFRIFRVGCDRDRWMRHKGTICWDYANGKIIYQD